MLARDTCPEPYAELFKRGTEPQEPCSFHTRAAVDNRDAEVHSLRDLDRPEPEPDQPERLRLE
jgi:hypothetical protein